MLLFNKRSVANHHRRIIERHIIQNASAFAFAHVKTVDASTQQIHTDRPATA